MEWSKYAHSLVETAAEMAYPVTRPPLKHKIKAYVFCFLFLPGLDSWSGVAGIFGLFFCYPPWLWLEERIFSLFVEALRAPKRQKKSKGLEKQNKKPKQQVWQINYNVASFSKVPPPKSNMSPQKGPL